MLTLFCLLNAGESNIVTKMDELARIDTELERLYNVSDLCKKLRKSGGTSIWISYSHIGLSKAICNCIMRNFPMFCMGPSEGASIPNGKLDSFKPKPFIISIRGQPRIGYRSGPNVLWLNLLHFSAKLPNKKCNEELIILWDDPADFILSAMRMIIFHLMNVANTNYDCEQLEIEWDSA